MGKNDDGWEKILTAKAAQLDEDGYFFLSAAKLKEISGREPRLMAKHDFSSSRPQVFKDRHLNILPTSRGNYLVGKFDLFHKFEDITSPVKPLRPVQHLESLGEINSETKALNALILAGGLEDFLGPGPYLATVNGRMSTNQIALQLGDLKLTVDRAQMEIDGGYESPAHLVLIEAKNHLSEDFNIRQLYFPFRRYQQEISKPVIPLYLVYSNGIFHLYRYEFENPADFRSIRLVSSARYTLERTQLTREYLAEVIAATQVADSTAPFPQADSFARVVNLIELVNLSPASKEDIALNYGFTPRQADYYTAAARYLGLMNKQVELTPAGKKFAATQDRDSRNLQLLRALAARPVFHEVLTRTFAHSQVPETEDIAAMLRAHGLGESTARRRAKTVSTWATWALDLIRETLPV